MNIGGLSKEERLSVLSEFLGVFRFICKYQGCETTVPMETICCRLDIKDAKALIGDISSSLGVDVVTRTYGGELYVRLLGNG